MFEDILGRRNTKNIKLKKSKNGEFSKGVSPLFCAEIGNVSILFLGKLGQESVFYDILERKNGFLYFKSSTLRKLKNIGFFFVYRFGPKLAMFPFCYFRQNRPRKCVSRYSRKKKPFTRLQKQQVIKVEKLFFLMGLVKNWQFSIFLLQPKVSRKIGIFP